MKLKEYLIDIQEDKTLNKLKIFLKHLSVKYNSIIPKNATDIYVRNTDHFLINNSGVRIIIEIVYHEKIEKNSITNESLKCCYTVSKKISVKQIDRYLKLENLNKLSK